MFKKLMLLILSASLYGTGTAVAAPLQSNSTYTVSKGDTAYSLAKRYGLKVDQLLALNHRSNTDLEIGEVLMVSPPTYTVVKGDTAYSVARKNGLSVDALLSFNNLSEPHLEIGQVLNLVGSAPIASAAPTNAPAPSAPLDSAPTVLQQSQQQGQLAQAATPLPIPDTGISPMLPASATGDWMSNAQSLLGVPYVWGGKSRSGTDCSGFVLQVFGPLGFSLPRTSAEQAQVGQAIGRQQLQRGDLVFFDTEGRGRVTHVGIALSGTEFINANSYAGRVAVDNLNSRYWASRYVGARRVLGVLAMNASASH